MPWYQTTIGNCDLFDSCGTFGLGVPINWRGYQNPLHGSAYAGIFAYGVDYREYVSVRLTDSLRQGNLYCCGFYVNRADTSLNAINRMGMYLSPDSIFAAITTALPYQPQVEHPPGTFLLDSVGWTLISDLYVAQGGEQFITIGNFRDDAGTLSWPTDGLPIYYYVDSVFVYEINPVSDLTGNDTTLCIDSSGTATLGKAAQSQLVYQWSTGDTTAEIIVSPATTTTYTLTVTDTSSKFSCDYSVMESVVVSIIDCDTIPIEPTNNFAGLANIFSPNGDGANDELYVRGTNINTVDLHVFNRWGEEIFSTTDVNTGWGGTYQGKPVNAGVYVFWSRVTYADGSEEVLKGNVTLVR